MTPDNARPEELNEFTFPWGSILFAMGASALLGVAVWQAWLSSRLWTTLLGEGIFWFAIAVYWLRRTARDEARLWKQRLAREENLVAAAMRAEERERVVE